jgi:pyruvate dehydrogenase E2 component (dihydrolipoamide acetyltransferase)
MTGMRGTIAGRMHASLREMAQLTLTMDVVMDAVIRDRADGGHATKPGYTDYVVAAVADTLTEHPLVNSQIHDGRLALLPGVDVGVAIALDGGLVVPVVEAADTLSIEELSAETTRLAAAARAGELTREELEGGTFSVTALGMYGVDAFTPVINPPNTAILGVGRLRDGVRWDDEVATRTTLLTLSLTWDHRAFDGAPAAEFTAGVRDRLETWGRSG